MVANDSTFEFLMQNSEEFRQIVEAQRIIASLPEKDRDTIRKLVRTALCDGYGSGMQDGFREPQKRKQPGQFADQNLWQYTDRPPIREAS